MQHDIQLACTPSRDSLPPLEEEQLLYLLVEILSYGDQGAQTRLPLDICLVLDNSSSMRGERLYQAKEAARHIVSQMSQQDYFCLVVFNDQAQVVVPRQQVRAPASLREHVTEIEASGGTEMARAMEQALTQMRSLGPFPGVRRLILLTDGQTYGDDNRCVELARQLQQMGAGITALGLGDDWNEDLLSTMAAHGNSRSEYISGAESVVSLFQQEMRLLQGILAQEMVLSLKGIADLEAKQFFRISPEVTSLPLREERAHEWLVPLGEWMGGEPQVFLAEMIVSPLPRGEHDLLQVELSYRLPREPARRRVHDQLTLPFRPQQASGMQVPSKLLLALEKLMAYRMQESAWREARRGNVDQATRRLRRIATRLVNMGESSLAETIEREALHLERTGRVSAGGKKEVHYGTQRLGRRWERDRKE
ncbi:MAG: VWA domain-containing protein [Chloroflexia bacterium]|nr:VWA domain-containing protein [Chloroflexia bacterium]